MSWLGFALFLTAIYGINCLYHRCKTAIIKEAKRQEEEAAAHMKAVFAERDMVFAELDRIERRIKGKQPRPTSGITIKK
jgi:hypothetical protein